MNKNDIRYKNKIMDNLTRINLTWDQFILLRYCGRDVVDKSGDYKTDPKMHTPNKYFQNKKLDVDFEKLITFKCICGREDLINHHFIHSPENKNDIITLGSCCKKRFLPKEQTIQTCTSCNIPHKGRLDAFCKKCRLNNIKWNEELFRFGKYKGQHIRNIVVSDPSYLRWLIKKDNPEYNFFLEYKLTQ